MSQCPRNFEGLSDSTNKCIQRSNSRVLESSHDSKKNYLSLTEDPLKDYNRIHNSNTTSRRKYSKNKNENQLKISPNSKKFDKLPLEHHTINRQDFDDILVKANIEFVDPNYHSRNSNTDNTDGNLFSQEHLLSIDLNYNPKENNEQTHYLKFNQTYKDTSKSLPDQISKEASLNIDEVNYNTIKKSSLDTIHNANIVYHSQLIENRCSKVTTKPKEDKSIDSEQEFTPKWYESFRSSLFSYVPPYILFKIYDSSKGVIFPPEIQEHIIWKSSPITPLVIRKTIIISGFKFMKIDDLSKRSHLWIGIWGKHIKAVNYRNLRPYQKLNHFPGTYQIGRKDRLWRNLSRLMIKYGKKEFGFMPRTFVLPQDLKVLKNVWEKSNHKERWIIKPPASARGIGIKIVNQWNQIPKRKSIIVQKYINTPYLINGNKFDLRIYVLVTSFHPMRIYIYEDGLVRFASVKYSSDITNINDRYMHLTNYSVNKLSSHYAPNDNATACQGHKWTLSSLWRYLKSRNVDVNALWENIKDLIIKTMISGENSITGLVKNNLKSRYSCYELFGVDVLLDSDLKPWLLEVNISPSLHSNSKLDFAVKGPMVRDLLNIVGYHMSQEPTDDLNKVLQDWLNSQDKITNMALDRRIYNFHLSREDKERQERFQEMKRDVYLREILSELSSDDVRHLIQAEDELTQSNGFIRVFPTSTTYLYHGFFEAPRYYNFLFDAWEHKYEHNRAEGIKLLQSFCDQRYHLQIHQRRESKLPKRFVKSKPHRIPEPIKSRTHVKKVKTAALKSSSSKHTVKTYYLTELLKMRDEIKNSTFNKKEKQDIHNLLSEGFLGEIDFSSNNSSQQLNLESSIFTESNSRKLRKYYYRYGRYPSQFLNMLKH